MARESEIWWRLDPSAHPDNVVRDGRFPEENGHPKLVQGGLPMKGALRAREDILPTVPVPQASRCRAGAEPVVEGPLHRTQGAPVPTGFAPRVVHPAFCEEPGLRPPSALTQRPKGARNW